MFLTQIINGQVSELALCEACARAKGLFDPTAEPEETHPEESTAITRARLEKELQQAIAHENYERAAQLRDQINTLPPAHS